MSLRLNNWEIIWRLGSHTFPFPRVPLDRKEYISESVTRCSFYTLCAAVLSYTFTLIEREIEREGTHCASACNLFFSDVLLCGSQDQPWWSDLRWTWSVSWINKEEGPRWRCWLKIKKPEASFLCLDCWRCDGKCREGPGRLSEGSSVRAGLI